jgi:hypothetical protein
MIPLRADVHRLWDVYEIGVDIHARPKSPASKRYHLNSTKQDMNRVISFLKGRADLASCHLNVNHLSHQFRPLPVLLLDHLLQGVYLWCLFPESQHSSRQHADELGPVAEGFETPLSPKDDDDDIVDLVDCISDRLTLNLDSSAGGKKEALDDLHQYDETGHGLGKAAFEKYLEMALSVVDYEL